MGEQPPNPREEYSPLGSENTVVLKITNARPTKGVVSSTSEYGDGSLSQEKLLEQTKAAISEAPVIEYG